MDWVDRILRGGEGGLRASGISVPQPALSISTLPYVLETSIALAALVSCCARRMIVALSPSTSAAKCVPRIPIVATFVVNFTLNGLRFASSPVNARTTPWRMDVEKPSPSEERSFLLYLYESTLMIVLSPRVSPVCERQFHRGLLAGDDAFSFK